MISYFPVYPSINSSWAIGCPESQPRNYLGYQAFNQSNLVRDPSTLGGLWFSSRKKTGKKKSTKKRSSRGSTKKRSSRGSTKKRSSKKTLRYGGPLLLTPGGISTVV